MMAESQRPDLVEFYNSNETVLENLIRRAQDNLKWTFDWEEKSHHL